MTSVKFRYPIVAFLHGTAIDKAGFVIVSEEPSMYQSLARWCFRHHWTVVGVWLALIIGLNAVGGAVGSAFDGEFTSTDSESDRGFSVLQEYFPGAAAHSAARSCSNATPASPTTSSSSR